MSRVAPIRPTREVKSDADDATRAPADLVDEMASELNLLSQTWTDPAAFLERRDYLVKRMRRLARRLKGMPDRGVRSTELLQATPAARAASWSARAPNVPSGSLAFGPVVTPTKAREILRLKGSHAARL